MDQDNKNVSIIPIDEARDIAKLYGMKQVIIVAWDGELEHVVTFGDSIEDCDQAAMGGDRIKAALGWSENVKYPSRVQKLRDALRSLVQYFGQPTDGNWAGLRSDDSLTLEHVTVRLGDVKNAWKLVE